MWKEVEGDGLVHVPSDRGTMTTKMTEQLEKFRLGIRKDFSRRVVKPWDHSRGETPSLECLKNGYHHPWSISRFGWVKSQLTWSDISDSPALNRRLGNRPARSHQHNTFGMLWFLWSTRHLSVCLPQNLIIYSSDIPSAQIRTAVPTSLETEMELW